MRSHDRGSRPGISYEPSRPLEKIEKGITGGPSSTLLPTDIAPAL